MQAAKMVAVEWRSRVLCLFHVSVPSKLELAAQNVTFLVLGLGFVLPKETSNLVVQFQV